MWWCGNAGGSTHPVGGKLANAFGLYDMHGNVAEWCKDVYDDNFYELAAAAGPDPVATSGSELRVRRGGPFSAFATNCRSADRPDFLPTDRSPELGFRPAWPLP